MSFLSNLSHWLVETLEPYGGPGLMLIAVGDSSFLSLPEVNDAALMALSINNPSRMWELAAMTVLGSVIGCSLLYAVGRRGGEAMLRRKFAADKVAKVRGWYQKFGMLAVIVPSLLPPPLPFKIFVLSAGAFEMSYLRFVLSVAIGRSIRYFTEGALAVIYGKRAVQMVAENAAEVGLVLAGVIVVGATVFFLARRRRAATAATLLLVCLLPLVSGCVATRSVPQSERMLPFFAMTRSQALERLDQMSRNIQSFQSSVSMEASTASTKAGEEFKRKVAPRLDGTLIMQRPGKILLTGGAFIRLFEMISDGTQYQVYTRENELYRGTEDGPPSKPLSNLSEVSNRFINLRPRQIQEAMLPDVLPLLSNSSIHTATYVLPVVQDRRRYLIVDFLETVSDREARLLQKLWFDLSTDARDLVRRQTFDKAGDLETDTRYSGHQTVGTGILRYPARVDVQFAETDTLLAFTIDPTQIVLNGNISSDEFDFPPHSGSKVFTFEPRDAVSETR